VNDGARHESRNRHCGIATRSPGLAMAGLPVIGWIILALAALAATLVGTALVRLAHYSNAHGFDDTQR
jgi:hypothetical protein